jgi:hypothetical protein
MTGYLDIDIKNNVYNNLRAPVHSVLFVTCIHTTPAVTVGGKREVALEGDTVTILGAEPGQTQWMMTWSRRRRKHKTPNLVAIVRFSSAMTEGEC